MSRTWGIGVALILMYKLPGHMPSHLNITATEGEAVTSPTSKTRTVGSERCLRHVTPHAGQWHRGTIFLILSVSLSSTHVP